MSVVVLGEDAEHAFEVVAVDDQKPVEALGAGGADEALGERVCLRRSHWRLDDLDSFAGEDGVEVAGELAVAVADEEAKRRSLLPECPGELSGLLGGPCAGRVGGAASQVDTSAAELDEEEHVQPLQPTVSTVKKSTASMLEACARRKARQDSPERSPTGPSPAWRRIFATVVAETAIPRPFSSPAIRW
jgi:hypothetical protein